MAIGMGMELGNLCSDTYLLVHVLKSDSEVAADLRVPFIIVYIIASAVTVVCIFLKGKVWLMMIRQRRMEFGVGAAEGGDEFTQRHTNRYNANKKETKTVYHGALMGLLGDGPQGTLSLIFLYRSAEAGSASLTEAAYLATASSWLMLGFKLSGLPRLEKLIMLGIDCAVDRAKMLLLIRRARKQHTPTEVSVISEDLNDDPDYVHHGRSNASGQTRRRASKCHSGGPSHRSLPAHLLHRARAQGRLPKLPLQWLWRPCRWYPLLQRKVANSFTLSPS